MRDLWLCTLLQYDKLQRKRKMKRKIWENGWDAGSFCQDSLPRLSSPSDHSSLLFPFFSPSMCYTHICRGLTKAHKAFVKKCDLTSAVFWMLISCSHCFQICIFMLRTSPLASLCPLHHFCFPQLPKTLLLAQSWPGLPVLFLVSLSVYLSLRRTAELWDIPSAHNTHFLSPNMGKRSPVRLRCWKSHFPPCPACFSYSVHIVIPVVHAFLCPSGLQRGGFMSKGWKIWVVLQEAEAEYKIETTFIWL